MTISSWRDLSVVLLSLETFVLLLIPGAVLFVAIRGTRWVLDRGRAGLRDVQGWAAKASEETDKVCARLVGPAVKVRVLPAGLKGLWTGVTELDSRR